MTIHRFHVPGVVPGSTELPEAAFNHATRVLRLHEGDRLRVFDNGFEFDAMISGIEKRRVLIEVDASLVQTRPERPIPLRLIMSPLKGDLTELVIQKATELGVFRISPAVFERTDTVAKREPTEARRERWHRVAVSAAEQAGRAVVPQVDAVMTLPQAVAALGPATNHERRIVALEPSIDHATTEPKATSAVVQSVIVAVGPAGGLTVDDLAVLNAAGFAPERFAPHTLRSETACIAAIAILSDRFK